MLKRSQSGAKVLTAIPDPCQPCYVLLAFIVLVEGQRASRWQVSNREGSSHGVEAGSVKDDAGAQVWCWERYQQQHNAVGLQLMS